LQSDLTKKEEASAGRSYYSSVDSGNLKVHPIFIDIKEGRIQQIN
jgi:hypothetical protein